MADQDHPYGYTNMRYVSSLISGVGIFCVGSGLSFYHGVTGILDPQPLHDFYWVIKFDKQSIMIKKSVSFYYSWLSVAVVDNLYYEV